MPGLQNTASSKKRSQCAALMWVALLGSLFLSMSVNAELYKWIDDSGKVYYKNTPPDQSQFERQAKQIGSYTRPEILTLIFDANAGVSQGSQNVIMYSTTWCGVCKMAKRYFRQNSIPFVEYDVENSNKGRQDFKKLGGKGMPIILVGNKSMVGFSGASFEKIYKR
mgnify:CR=1 FL=1